MPRFSPDQRLGAYELIEPIGRGGMGEVWRALDPALRRHVAIKVLPEEYSRDPDRLRRFTQEAQAASLLNHPHVLTIYAVGEHDQSPYLVTELLEGETLRERLTRGPLPEVKALEFGDEIVQGLAAAHHKGIVHRDLKPENIFITADGHVKILDFGLAKLAPSGPDHDAPTQTAPGVAVGTPAYMSPEQVRGHDTDHRSDVFAVGAVLYEMLAGRRAFSAPTNVETMNAILNHEPAPLAGISTTLDQIIRHCLEKEPADRYHSARDLGFQLRLARHPQAPAHPIGVRRRRALAAVAGVIVVAAAGASTWWWLTRDAAGISDLSYKRVTFDSGLTTDPALSSDGQLIAYASDRAGAGNLDIWRQQIATSEAIRLTTDPADESEPAFSPDGGRIAFRSERDGGGIYVVSTFGGEPRLVAKEGRRPRFSPDGREIAYWVVTGPVPYIGKAYTVPAVGGAPTPIEPTFASARYPVWSSDGTRLLFVGAREQQDVGATQDWWITSRNADRAVKTGAIDVFQRQRLSGPAGFTMAPTDWIDNDVFFSAALDETTSLWRIVVSAETGTVGGDAERLTSGTSVETKPSVTATGRIAFASLKQDLNIWSVPIAADGVRTIGEPEQVTGSSYDAHTSLSADGTKLVFISTRSGTSDVWMKNLASGAETALTASPAIKEQAEITGDGTRVAYTIRGASTWEIYEIPTAGGVPEKLCDKCGRPWDWSPDGVKLLYLIPEGATSPGLSLGIVDARTREKSVYLTHPHYSLARARFSPDGRWISFTAFTTTPVGTPVNRIVIAPFHSPVGPLDREWIVVAQATRALDKARWSPDGSLLYYLSEADGFRCIHAQRLNPTTKMPLGPPIDIYHSHSARRSLMSPWLGSLELSVSQGKLFFNLGETTGSIWTAEWK
jgi:Tol biopolymer transport system component